MYADKGRLKHKGMHVFKNRAYAYDVMAAILVFQNNNAAAMLLYQTNPVTVQLFSYINSFYCSINLYGCLTCECIRSITTFVKVINA